MKAAGTQKRQRFLMMLTGAFAIFFTGFPHVWSIYQPYVTEGTGWTQSQGAMCFYLALSALMMLTGAFAIFFTGFPHVWSIYQPYVTEGTGWTQSQGAMCFYLALSAFVFGNILGGRMQNRFGPRKVLFLGGGLLSAGILMSAFSLVSSPNILGGRMQNRFGPRKVLFLGGGLLSAGILMSAFSLVSSPLPMYLTYGVMQGLGQGMMYTVILAAFLGGGLLSAGILMSAFSLVSSPLPMYLTYGVMQGLGQGMMYTVILAAAQQWFPDRTGFASGIVVTANGLCGLFMAPFCRNPDVSIFSGFFSASYVSDLWRDAGAWTGNDVYGDTGGCPAVVP